MEIQKQHPSNSYSQASIEHLVLFIDNVVVSYDQPLPGRMPNFWDCHVLLLPIDMSKSNIYQQYLSLCQRVNESPVGRSKFYEVWKETRSYIVTMKPASDLCFDCQQMTSEEMSHAKRYTNHLERVKKSRADYNQQITMRRAAYNSALFI